jgi:hypothetical protein
VAVAANDEVAANDDVGANDDIGGDPVCWASRVCPDCGRLAGGREPVVCAECGAELPA